MRRARVSPYRAALAVALVLLFGWASVGATGGRGGGRGGQGFHGGRGGGSSGGFHGHRGGRFHGSGRHGFGHHRGFGHHHGFRSNAFIGVAPLFLWGPGSVYYTPYYTPPPPVYVQPEPVGYWYYCPSARAYYPYVAACPESWVLVPAH